MKTIRFAAMLTAVLAMSWGMSSCSSDDSKDDSPVEPSVTPVEPPVNANTVLNIPQDDQATPAPAVTTPTVALPNVMLNVSKEKGYILLSIDMTGVWNEGASDWLSLYGTGQTEQNVWVSIDDVPKGIEVYNNAQDNSRTLLADVVFLVDNSGSMSEEAEAISNSIIAWSEFLTQSGLDLRVGCVGYGDSWKAVDGAYNMSKAEDLAAWMYDNGYGTRRTHTFGGEDAEALKEMAQGDKYDNGTYNECGMVALRFAHDLFNFRNGANRIYVNFTDEPNQPSGIEDWSVEYLNPENGNWHSNYGTVHSVFSEDKDYYYWSDMYNEKPWLMAEYTGGTKIFTDAAFTDFTLENLPVTGAMQNSYVLRMTNIDNLFDGQEHKITITVYTKDGVMAVKDIYYRFVENETEE